MSCACRIRSVAASIVLTSTAAHAADVHVSQLDWLGPDGAIAIPLSRVISLEFAFDPGNPEDAVLLGPGGFVNVVDIDGDWLVQNLYLRYDDPPAFEAARPSVLVGLNQPNGLPLEVFAGSVSVSPNPLFDPPPVVGEPRPVVRQPYHVGGIEGGGSGLSAVPLVIGPWIGPIFPIPEDWAFTSSLAPIRAVDEELNGCAPASAARSIQYMGDVNGFATDSSQSIYGDLKGPMNTDVGPNSGGTSVPDFLSGKDAYVDGANLPIDTRQVFGIADICAVADAIEMGGDVEIMIAWDGGGGHAAMITGVVKWPDGSVSISYVDDPTQGDGMAANQTHVIHVRPDGTFDGGSIIGFQIEEVDPCPVDLDGDGEVDFDDLVQLLAAWGDCPGPGSCEEDFDGDGEVGFSDLVELLAKYGPCD